MRPIGALVALLVLAAPELLGNGGPPPLPPGPAPVPQPARQVALPAGTWKVEYANEVAEVCSVQADGAAAVVEPVRLAGRAVVNGGAVVMVFDNGRVQRWTPVGKRYVVEHWFPGSRFPTAAPGTQGIAEPAPK
jgi:hypothetical protein